MYHTFLKQGSPGCYAQSPTTLYTYMLLLISNILSLERQSVSCQMYTICILCIFDHSSDTQTVIEQTGLLSENFHLPSSSIMIARFDCVPGESVDIVSTVKNSIELSTTVSSKIVMFTHCRFGPPRLNISSSVRAVQSTPAVQRLHIVKLV